MKQAKITYLQRPLKPDYQGVAIINTGVPKLDSVCVIIEDIPQNPKTPIEVSIRTKNPKLSDKLTGKFMILEGLTKVVEGYILS